MRLLAYAALLGLVLVLGWKEPLSYRFMSRAEIHALEHPAQPVSEPQLAATPEPWMWKRSGRTRLER